MIIPMHDQDRISPYNIKPKNDENKEKYQLGDYWLTQYQIVHFTVVSLVAKPSNRSEAKGDLVMIQTLLLFKCKLLCYHAN